MARGRRRVSRNRDESPGARQRPKPSTRSSTARDRWKRPLIGALVAVPVGLGVAAGLVLAQLPQGHGPAQAGSDVSNAFPDDGLPPAVSDDDFFPDSGDADGGSSDSADGEGRREAAATAEGEVKASESPEGGSGSSAGGDASAPGGSGSSGGSANAGSSGGSGSPGGSSGGGSGRTADVVTLANSERAAAGCEPLRVDERLTTASQKHSEDMAARDYMAHDTPEGTTPAQRATEAGYDAWSGENVAAGQRSADEVMDAWMNSDGHRANILNCDFKAIGVGEADGRWTQNFGWE